jgi:two-component system sensor histidine kinase BaeS
MRIRLIISFLLLILVTIGVFMFVIVRQNAQEVSNFIARNGLTGSEQVMTALEDYFQDYGTWEGVDDVLRSAPLIPRTGMFGRGMGQNQGKENRSEIPGFHLLLTDADGFLMARTGPVEMDGEDRLTQFELSRGVPLDVDGETVGYVLVEGGQAFSAASEISLLSRLNQAAIIAVAVAVLAALLLALFLSYSLVRPVRALERAASQLATGDLSQRVEVKGKDELAALGSTFNHMAESLQLAEASRRAMTADIAHELRTPLAVQRAHLEAIEDGVYPLTPDSLLTIEEQNHLLTRLVDDLRTLALADAGQLTLQVSVVDFPALLRRVSARFEPQNVERGINIQFFIGECPPVAVDAQRIQQILNNLLSNALRYTPNGGVIECRLRVQDGTSAGFDSGFVPLPKGQWVSLEVRDSGPGIEESALPHIFDRFYRVDKSRSRAEGGTGLGLSIARKLAQAHGGDLAAANHPQGGAVFRLTLPI